MVCSAVFYSRKHEHGAIVLRSGWTQALGLFLAEAPISTVTTQADVPGMQWLITSALCSSSLCFRGNNPSALLSAPTRSPALPNSDLQGMGKWAGEEARRRRQPLWPCPRSGGRFRVREFMSRE